MVHGDDQVRGFRAFTALLPRVSHAGAEFAGTGSSAAHRAYASYHHSDHFKEGERLAHSVKGTRCSVWPQVSGVLSCCRLRVCWIVESVSWMSHALQCTLDDLAPFVSEIAACLKEVDVRVQARTHRKSVIPPPSHPARSLATSSPPHFFAM